MNKSKRMKIKVLEIIDKKTSGKRLQNAVVFAFVLYAFLLFSHFIVRTSMPEKGNDITNWQFVCGNTDKSISGNQQLYKLASSKNPVAKESGKDYIRLHYTIPASLNDQRLTVTTAYNPVKILLNNKEEYNNEYGESAFTGSCYQSIIIKGTGSDQIIDIFVYSPLAFGVSANLTNDTISNAEDFRRYSMFGISIALLVIGIALFILSILLTSNRNNIVRLMWLSFTVFFAGLTSLGYSLATMTTFLSKSYWFPIILLMYLLLMMLVYISILSCMKQALNNTMFFIPVLIIFILIPVFNNVMAVRIVAVVFAIAELYIAVKGIKILSEALTIDVPKAGCITGLLLFAAFTNIYNTCGIIFGLGMFSGYIYCYSIGLSCIVLFVLFCQQVIFLEAHKYVKLVQFYEDPSWMQGLNNLISCMFGVDDDENKFLVEVSNCIAAIINKNSNGVENISIKSCIGVIEDDKYTEIYNSGDVMDCDYDSITSYLESIEPHILIGNTIVDMLFIADNHKSVIHFENITCGIYKNNGDIITVVYENLFDAYNNLFCKEKQVKLRKKAYEEDRA